MALVVNTLRIRLLASTVRHQHYKFLALNRIQHKQHRLCSVAIPLPSDQGELKAYPEHIQKIVSDISHLNLLEVADLNELLKSTLNISDAPMAMMPAGGMMAAGPAASDQAEEDAGPAAPRLNMVTLTAYDATKKVAVIKEIKATMEGMNLVQAKKFVEALPQVVKTDLKKEDAEELKKKLEAVGAELKIDEIY